MNKVKFLGKSDETTGIKLLNLFGGGGNSGGGHGGDNSGGGDSGHGGGNPGGGDSGHGGGNPGGGDSGHGGDNPGGGGCPPNPCHGQIKFNAEDYTVSATIIIPGCTDYKQSNLGDIPLSSQGRLLDLSCNLKNVCANRQVAIGIFLNELNSYGREKPYAFKSIFYPGHACQPCHDVTIDHIHFVLPEVLDASGNPDSMCNARKFVAKVTAHYINTGSCPAD